MDLIESMQLLAKYSNFAKRIYKYGKFVVITIFEENGNITENYCTDKEFGFHIGKNAGIVALNDEYIFDIRCEHLQWTEGWIEYDLDSNEPNLCMLKTLDKNGKIKNSESPDGNVNAIMISGNHKGSFVQKLIIIPY